MPKDEMSPQEFLLWFIHNQSREWVENQLMSWELQNMEHGGLYDDGCLSEWEGTAAACGVKLLT
jgi:hypothetical protein